MAGLGGVSWSTVIVLAVLLAAGAGLAVQAPVNATLARHAGGLVTAAFLSFLVGFLVLLAYTLARGAWPSLESLAEAPWWAWTGGLFGILFLIATSWSVGQVGVLTTLAAAILGQLLAAIIVDRIGAFGLPVREISLPRLAGVAMIASGLILSRF
jgi:bacterial/archaeal transporter family-2 protein